MVAFGESMLCMKVGLSYAAWFGMGHDLGVVNEISMVSCEKHASARKLVPADVYSYPEDDTVEDPLLAKHLQHFGIDFSSLQKVSPLVLLVT
jgi:hypothetical protein